MNKVVPMEHDIFISYAHIDDTPLMGEEAGWVSKFHTTLDALVKQIAGDDLTIWRDLRLQGNDYFSDTLVETLPKAAVLICVLSPRYVKSDWCLKELETFTQAAEGTGGIRRGDRSRIFKVLKTIVPRELQPPPLDSLLVADYLYSQGLEVLLPVFDGAEAQVRKDHIDKQVYSDAIVISTHCCRWHVRKCQIVAGAGGHACRFAWRHDDERRIQLASSAVPAWQCPDSRDVRGFIAA